MSIPMSKSDELTLAVGRALAGVFISPNVSDSNGEAANIVDVIDGLAQSMRFAARHLGNGDASTQGWGALEAHGKAMLDAAGIVSEGLHDVADALRERAPEQLRG